MMPMTAKPPMTPPAMAPTLGPLLTVALLPLLPLPLLSESDESSAAQYAFGHSVHV